MYLALFYLFFGNVSLTILERMFVLEGTPSKVDRAKYVAQLLETHGSNAPPELIAEAAALLSCFAQNAEQTIKELRSIICDVDALGKVLEKSKRKRTNAVTAE